MAQKVSCLGNALLLQERMVVVGNQSCSKRYQPLIYLG